MRDKHAVTIIEHGAKAGRFFARCAEPGCPFEITRPRSWAVIAAEVTEHQHHTAGPASPCDWVGHQSAIDEAGFCPVCQ